MIRTIETRVDVLRNGAPLKQLRTVETPRIRMRARSAITSSMQLECAPDDTVDWLKDELQPVLVVDGVEHPLGIFAPATVTPSATDGQRRVSVEAFDRCWRVQCTRTESLLHLASGTNYIQAIKTLLTAAGVAAVTETPTHETLANDREDWQAGESYLTIINQLLEEINYKNLWFNERGTAVLEPKRIVSAEYIVRTYDASKGSCLMIPEISAKLDIYNAPNVWICVCANPDGSGPMVAVAENNNPVSPLSIVRRGRRIAETKKVRNIASQEALEEYAAQLCQSGMLLGTTVDVKTGIMPGCGPDDIVALVHPEMEGLCRESEWQMELAPGGVMTHKLEKVVLNL